MSSEAFITIEGGLTRDIRLNVTSSGKTVVTLPLAVGTRVKNRETGEYEDGPSMYYDVVVYGRTAENIANSETFKGQRFIVYGEVERRVWSGKDGGERDTNKIYARLIGASYRNATITATRNSRGQFTNGGGVNGGGQNPQYGGQAGGGGAVGFSEGGVAVHLRAAAFAQDELRLRHVQLRVQRRVRRALHAVRGPEHLGAVGQLDDVKRLAARMVGGE